MNLLIPLALLTFGLAFIEAEQPINVSKLIKKCKSNTSRLHNYSSKGKYRITPLSSSMNSGRFFLVNIVLTTAYEESARNHIRSTWSSVSNIAGLYQKTLFVVGTTKFRKDDLKLKSENRNYNDILQIDVPETINNSSLKLLHALQFVLAKWETVQLFTVVNDDIMINIPVLMHQFYPIMVATQATSPNIYCRAKYKDTVARNGGLWSLTRDQWAENTFPTYCQANAVVLLPQLAKVLVECASFVTYVPFWDVYLTGIVAQKAGINTAGPYASYNYCSLMHSLVYSSTTLAECLFIERTNYVSVNRWTSEKVWKSILYYGNGPL